MPLLEPKPGALRPHGPGAPAPDRVPDRMAAGTPPTLRAELTELLGAEKVLWKVSDLVRYATDASPYRFVPQVVVIAEDIDDVSAVLSYAHGRQREVVFRAAGTSLNGQAQGEDILVDVRRHWAGIEVLEGGRRARIRPGTTILRANAALARHGRILGPDPASAIACTLGGVVANNASGMTAGTTRNSYRTLSSLTLVLPTGTVVDTADPLADEELARAELALCHGLMEIKREIEADPELVARIRAKYEIKNTTGYRLDAYLDGTTPVEILRGLMVGSEGTLGFISEVVFDTLPLDRELTTGLLFFPSLPAAAAAVPLFNEAGALAVELMDGNTLRASVSVAGVPADWAGLPKDTAALLVEFRAPDAAGRAVYERRAAGVLAGLELIAPVASVTNAFTSDPAVISGYWKARKAFVTAVGGARAPGTTLITEDFAVPPSRLAEACEALLVLQAEHGFDAAVAGHAAHGNLHFLLAFDASVPADVERYAAFMDAFCRLHRRTLRRLPEGRALHGPQHGPLPRTRMGPPGHRTDVAHQARRRPGPRPRPADPPRPRPPGPSARAEDDPPRRGRRRPVHRVRLLRTGLPQPGPDDHPAPADRAAPRDDAPAARLPRARRPARRLRLRRRGHLRRMIPSARSPAPSASTPAR